jgi:hypothetical protein
VLSVADPDNFDADPNPLKKISDPDPTKRCGSGSATLVMQMTRLTIRFLFFVLPSARSLSVKIRTGILLFISEFVSIVRFLSLNYILNFFADEFLANNCAKAFANDDFTSLPNVFEDNRLKDIKNVTIYFMIV